MFNKNSTSFKNAWTFTLSLFAIVLLMSWQPVAAQTCTDNDKLGLVQPTTVPGNPAENTYCTKAFRIEFGDKPGQYGFVDGWYDIPGGKVYLDFSTGDCGPMVSWEAGPGVKVDLVVVKGGDNANVYDYSGIVPRPMSDDYLHSPIAGGSGKYAAVSHIDFCYRVSLQVSKTAVPTYKLRYSWEIKKEADATYNIFRGDQVEHGYKVSVTKSAGVAEAIKVTGKITIYNPAETPVEITSVEDVISGVGAVVPDCKVTFPYTLGAGETLECTYSKELDDLESRTNTVTVKTTGPVEGGTASAEIIFGEPSEKINDKVTVNDDNGKSWTTSATASWEYTEDYTCFGSEGEYMSTCEYVNTATIAETGQKASAKVIINCYELVVTKTAETSFDRLYKWKIDKKHDAGASCLVLAEGQMYTVKYSVVVDIASFVDSNWKVAGEITVSNPAPMAATITSLTDMITGGIAATVNCPALTVPAKGSVTCTYSADLPDGTNRTNTATATLPNVYYKADKTTGSNGSIDFSGKAEIDFSKATINEIDECVDVTDSYAGALGTVCKAGAPKTFTYSRDIGVEQGGTYDCGAENKVGNTATFTTNDTGATGSDDADVCYIIPCPGCTLTPGYWKTHSIYGPAPYDETWALLGEDTPFFLSGKTYYEVLWTPPAGGNAYFILAHAYIAAELNLLNGAHFAAAQLSFDKATALLEKYTPAQIGALKGKTGTEIRNQFVELASILDKYNNGLIGPGHCSDNSENTKYGALEMPSLIETQGATELKVYPNPFSTRVTFEFVAGRDADARIEIFNMLGQKVGTVMDQFVREGVLQRVEFAPMNIERGMLFYRLTLDEEVFNGKVLYNR